MNATMSNDLIKKTLDACAEYRKQLDEKTNEVARLKEENNTLLKNFLRTQNILENVTESRDTMIEDRNLLDNEVARLRKEIALREDLDAVAQEVWDELKAENARLRELLNRAIEIAKITTEYIEDPDRRKCYRSAIQEIAPAPEEPSWKCNHQFTRYDDDTRDFVCTDCCAHLDVTATPEEPTIKQSQIVQSDPVPTQPPTQNEWRELGPDEVICEGDECRVDNNYGLWTAIPECQIGTTPMEHNGYTYRTRRPLPKQEEMPLEDEIERIETRDAWIDPTKDIIACIRYLRDEIQKLKEAR